MQLYPLTLQMRGVGYPDLRGFWVYASRAKKNRDLGRGYFSGFTPFAKAQITS
ncbi:hypothetical protein AEST_09430 [Alishewanella aestuarii B11]|uniref:Uncharacterized protein n=1 Tax=Alishewanella aestuarii B11 TaxID=1197174 RepID=J2IG78_9ALTE|nr:hypothetical protein AEST_09430 [Alishewanella aestuarii B11]